MAMFNSGGKITRYTVAKWLVEVAPDPACGLADTELQPGGRDALFLAAKDRIQNGYI